MPMRNKNDSVYPVPTLFIALNIVYLTIEKRENMWVVAGLGLKDFK